MTNLSVRGGQIRLSSDWREQGGGREYLIVDCGSGFMAVTLDDDSPCKSNSSVLDPTELYRAYPINLGQAKITLNEGAEY